LAEKSNIPRIGDPTTAALSALSAPVQPTEVFRFAAPCQERACVHFDGTNCRLASRNNRYVTGRNPISSELPFSIRLSLAASGGSQSLFCVAHRSSHTTLLTSWSGLQLQHKRCGITFSDNSLRLRGRSAVGRNTTFLVVRHSKKSSYAEIDLSFVWTSGDI
jgi:hypothetical protein